MHDTASLFQPFHLKSLSLKNRIVMAPMTRSFSPGGAPGQDVVDYYGRRAESEVGLILSEGTVIERPASRNNSRVPRFHGEDALAGWKQVITRVHNAGGKMGPQLWHVGAVPNTGLTNADMDWAPDGPVESPSGLHAPNDPRGVAMSEEMIADTIDAFARAAKAAKALDFDTIEIHGAHGYLIDQFFWSGTNLRNDRYGGKTLSERTRFAVEVVSAVRNAVGEDFPILMRLSQWKQQDYQTRMAHTLQELENWLAPLADAGVDMFHCSQRRFWEAEFPGIDGLHGLNYAGWTKKLTGRPTITVGSVGLSGDFLQSFGGESLEAASLDNLLIRLEREEFDLVAVGRALLAEPAWASKVHAGAFDQLRPFDRDMLGCLY